jgi:hypothetical protein
LTSWARPEDYTELYEAQAPRPNSKVWLGGNPNKLTTWHHAHRYPVPLHGRDPQEVHGYGASLALFYVLVGYAGPVGLRLRDDAARALKEIWPVRRSTLKWPPTIAFPSDEPQAIPTPSCLLCGIAALAPPAGSGARNEHPRQGCGHSSVQPCEDA